MQRTCARCGRIPARGWAQINDDWYCHGDEVGPDGMPKVTCYEIASTEQMMATWRWLKDFYSNPNPNQGEQRQP